MGWQQAKLAIRDAAANRFSALAKETHGIDENQMGVPEVRGFGSLSSLEERLANRQEILGEVVWPGGHRVTFTMRSSDSARDLDWGEFKLGFDEERSSAADSEGMALEDSR